jgi:Flp pilus assembly protein CpaB
VRRRLPFYILAAFILAVAAGSLTFVYLERLRASAVPTHAALVARVDIRPGTVLDETMVEVRQVPDTVLPAGALESPAQAAGRAAIAPLAAGEVILPIRLSGGEGGLASRLPDGRWAMVLPSGWLAAPLPSLAAGDRIELMAYQAGQPADEAGVIVSAVEVLEVVAPGAHRRIGAGRHAPGRRSDLVAAHQRLHPSAVAATSGRIGHADDRCHGRQGRLWASLVATNLAVALASFGEVLLMDLHRRRRGRSAARPQARAILGGPPSRCRRAHAAMSSLPPCAAAWR